jgi:hypothetical protein
LKKNENDSTNVVTEKVHVVIEEVHDAILLSINTPIDSWVLESRASFIPHRPVKSLRIMLLEIL